MKKRMLIMLLAVIVLLFVPHVASANSPAPDPMLVKLQYKNVEIGSEIEVLFAGEDGSFHANAYGPRTVTERSDHDYFRCTETDTQLCVEWKKADGTALRSNILPIDPVNGSRRPVFSYDGRTNEVKDITGTLGASDFSYVFLFIGIIVLELLAAFALTLLCEFLVGLCFRMKPFRYIIFANLITNVPMNIVLLLVRSMSGGLGYWIALVVLELVVLLIEFLFYRKKYRGRKKVRYILLFTVAANAVSLGAGLLLLRLIYYIA